MLRKSSTSGRSRWTPWLLGFLVFALAAAGMSYVFFSRWTEVTDALPPEAERLFRSAVVEAGGGTPYIEFSADGTALIHHEQEGTGPVDFHTLTLLAWLPEEEKVLRIDYPRWFVWLKTFSSLNLGTMISVVRRDWKHLDLSVSYEDLRRRGPGLLLDHRMANGTRILLWTTPGGTKP